MSASTLLTRISRLAGCVACIALEHSLPEKRSRLPSTARHQPHSIGPPLASPARTSASSTAH